jgi:hypothetical protein
MVDVSTITDLTPVSQRETEFCLGRPETSSPTAGEWRSKDLTDALQRLIVQLENDSLLTEPYLLRERLDALDRLDAYFPCIPQEAAGFARFGQGLSRRAKAIRDRFEAVNTDLYKSIRWQIQHGLQPHDLLRWLPSSLPVEYLYTPANGMGYDYIDELISGVFGFEEPEDEHIPREPEKLFYQPTPAWHIFSLISLTALTSDDVFVDLGSGLGHVPMMVSICTEARSLGIEIEATYVERAQQCARGLNLNQVTFIQQDAREADLSEGTVFYLYTPFVGSILRKVLKRLRREAAARQIRICCYGPCTSVVAEESWLAATTTPDANLVTVFRSRA